MFKIQFSGSGEIFYATPYSAGFDITTNEGGVLASGERKLLSTGLFLVNGPEEFAMVDKVNKNSLHPVIPELQIRSRSGLAWKNGVSVLNAPGTIDFDYLAPKEIKVMLINHGSEPFYYAVGDRIAQGVCALTLRCPGVKVQEAARTGGFGSTGVSSGNQPVPQA